MRERAEYPDLKRKVRALARRYAPSVILIENAGPGMNLLQDLRAEDKLVPWPIGRKPKGSKEERMVAEAAKIEAGHVVLPKDAPWLPAYLNELLAFPNGRHDDQVDSTSQFLNDIVRRRADLETGHDGGMLIPRTLPSFTY